MFLKTLFALGIIAIASTFIFHEWKEYNKPAAPFPLEKCDEWLRKAEDSWTGPGARTRSDLATACYLSHILRR